MKHRAAQVAVSAVAVSMVGASSLPESMCAYSDAFLLDAGRRSNPIDTNSSRHTRNLYVPNLRGNALPVFFAVLLEPDCVSHLGRMSHHLLGRIPCPGWVRFFRCCCESPVCVLTQCSVSVCVGSLPVAEHLEDFFRNEVISRSNGDDIDIIERMGSCCSAVSCPGRELLTAVHMLLRSVAI